MTAGTIRVTGTDGHRPPLHPQESPRRHPSTLCALRWLFHNSSYWGDAKGLRIDVMTCLRDFPPFEALWNRRATVVDEDGTEVSLLSVEDLVKAKKTQRGKDWPMIGALVEGHYKATGNSPNPDRIRFWLTETRTPERLLDLVSRFAGESHALLPRRPLLGLAMVGDLPRLREALDAEVRAEQEKDRTYWQPLKREMEAFRRAEREEEEQAGHRKAETGT